MLLLSFQLQETPNQYRPRSSGPWLGDIPELVTLTTTDHLLPLPDGEYLRLHAACANVAHLSGAAEYLEILYREMEETVVLASDGTSSEILSLALECASVRVG